MSLQESPKDKNIAPQPERRLAVARQEIKSYFEFCGLAISEFKPSRGVKFLKLSYVMLAFIVGTIVGGFLGIPYIDIIKAIHGLIGWLGWVIAGLAVTSLSALVVIEGARRLHGRTVGELNGRYERDIKALTDEKDRLLAERAERFAELSNKLNRYQNPQVDMVFNISEVKEAGGQSQTEVYISVRSFIPIKDLRVEIARDLDTRAYQLHEKDDEPPYKPVSDISPGSGEKLFHLATRTEATGFDSLSPDIKWTFHTNEPTSEVIGSGGFILTARASNTMPRVKRVSIRSPQTRRMPITFNYFEDYPFPKSGSIPNS